MYYVLSFRKWTLQQFSYKSSCNSETKDVRAQTKRGNAASMKHPIFITQISRVGTTCFTIFAPTSRSDIFLVSQEAPAYKHYIPCVHINIRLETTGGGFTGRLTYVEPEAHGDSGDSEVACLLTLTAPYLKLLTIICSSFWAVGREHQYKCQDQYQYQGTSGIQGEFAWHCPFIVYQNIVRFEENNEKRVCGGDTDNGDSGHS